jgi:hypothetical protein
MRIGHDAPSRQWLQQAEFSEVYLVKKRACKRFR